MSDEEMTLGLTKFDHNSLMRFEQWPGGTPNHDGMGFEPFPDRPPVPPPPQAPPRIRHAPFIGTQNQSQAIDDEHERQQET